VLRPPALVIGFLWIVCKARLSAQKIVNAVAVVDWIELEIL
jgi:hypothetical protein